MSHHIQEIWQENDRTLAITWTDQQTSRYDVVRLRERCPCAQCVNEFTGERKPLQIDPSVRPSEMFSVGQYAMQIHFSDGHRTGIYSFDLLRKLSS